MAGWDPTAWFSGDLDPANVGKNKSQVQGQSGGAPTISQPTQGPSIDMPWKEQQVSGPAAPKDVTGPTNTAPVPTMAAPTQGPQQTTIANTAGPSAASVNMAGIGNVGQMAGYAGPGQQNQAALMQQLAAQANGTAPSVSGMQLQQGQANNLAATMAQLASARGAANPLMQRQAMQQGSDSQAATNQQAALMRLQEQQGAQGLLGQVAGQSVNQGLAGRGQDIGIRQQDLGTAQQNAGFQQQAGLAGYQGNLQTNLAQAGINAQNASQLFGAQQNANQQNAGFQQGYNNLGLQYAGMGQQAQLANQAAGLQTQQLAQQAQRDNQSANLQNQQLWQQAQHLNQNNFFQNQQLGQNAQLANQGSYWQGQHVDQASQIANANIAQANAAASARAIGGEMNSLSSLSGSGALDKITGMFGGGGGGGAAGGGAMAALAADGGVAPDSSDDPMSSFGSAVSSSGGGDDEKKKSPDDPMQAFGNSVISNSRPAQITGGSVAGYAHGGEPGGYASGKAQVSGDSTKNDKVPAWISPGEVVLPRTVVNAKDPIEAFKTFMATVHTKPIGHGHEPDDALKTVMEAQARIRGKK